MTIRTPLRALPLGLAVALAACTQAPGGQHPASTAAPALSPVDQVADRLNQGDEAGARKLLKKFAKKMPGDASLAVLQESLDGDPVQLLGPKNHPYAVQTGDTMQGIAEHLLGNRLKFYQLARYNGIKVPAALMAGNLLKIPGEAPKPVAPPPPPAPPEKAPTKRPAKSHVAEPKPAAPAPAAVPAAPAANPAQARQLRSAGLAALNGGKVGNAVALLRHAAQLDPTNPLIARDLDRAERIARTVQSRR
jgi:hypothetical protein